jgi:hypothetical protein
MPTTGHRASKTRESTNRQAIFHQNEKSLFRDKLFFCGVLAES